MLLASKTCVCVELSGLKQNIEIHLIIENGNPHIYGTNLIIRAHYGEINVKIEQSNNRLSCPRKSILHARMAKFMIKIIQSTDIVLNWNEVSNLPIVIIFFMSSKTRAVHSQLHQLIFDARSIF